MTQWDLMVVNKRQLSKVPLKLSGVLAVRWERIAAQELEGEEGRDERVRAVADQRADEDPHDLPLDHFVFGLFI